jgi:phosphopantothenoylcysteine synthetase/decarboxylase
MSSSDLVLIVCGAPLTARTPDLVDALAAAGWRPTVVATAAAAPWLDVEAVTRVVGEPPLTDFRTPGEPKRGGAPAVVVVCPATFNTVNKAAAGINDSYPLGVLCEALGTGTPVVVVPMVNNKLWGHPVWSRNLTALVDAGVTMLDVHTGAVGASAVESGTGGQVVAHFDPEWLPAQLKRLRETEHRKP